MIARQIPQMMARFPRATERMERVRFRTLLYGMFRLMQFTPLIDENFKKRIAEKDVAFAMTSREKGAARYFRFSGGKVQSRRLPMPVDFTLVWKDEATGGRVMTDMVTGNRKALANAVIEQNLSLEGDAGLVFWFLETVNRMAKVYMKKKKKKQA